MISIKDIKNTLSEWTFNLGSLCRSSRVNRWSFFKPVSSSKMTQLTTQDYFDLDDGFHIQSYFQPYEMLCDLQDPQTNLWTYDTRTAPYRLSDFSEYNHYAVPMFELSFINMNTGAAGDTLQIAMTGDLQSVVNNWASYRTYAVNCDVVLLIYSQGTEYDGTARGVGIYKVCQWLDYDGERIPFHIPQGLSVGDYTLVPCITTATGRMSAQEYQWYNPNGDPLTGMWLPLPPHSKLNFSVVQTSPSHIDFYQLFNFSQVEAVDFTYTDYNYELRDISFTNYVIYSPYNSTRQFGVSIEYWYNNCATPVMLGSAYRTFSADNIVEQISINYRDTITVITGARLDEGIMSIEQRITIYSLGESQSKTYTISAEIS